MWLYMMVRADLARSTPCLNVAWWVHPSYIQQLLRQPLAQTAETVPCRSIPFPLLLTCFTALLVPLCILPSASFLHTLACAVAALAC